MDPKTYAFFGRVNLFCFWLWTAAYVAFFAGYASNTLLDDNILEMSHLWDVLIGMVSTWPLYPSLAALVRWAFTGRFSFLP